MAETAILTEGTTAIVSQDRSRFSWGIVLAGAFSAVATSFFLLTLGSAIGLALGTGRGGAPVTTAVTLGAIYFLAAQAFGFAVGGYVVGRLIGPEAENTAEEEFGAAAHGLAVWALVVVASLLILSLVAAQGGSAVAGAIASRPESAMSHSGYWTDVLFRPAPNTPQVIADKAEASRILVMNKLGPLSDDDANRLAHMVSMDAGLPPTAALNRVSMAQAQWAQASDAARKTGSIVMLWTALSLLFGAAVAVASAISARWMDDRISFSLKARR
jgi:hypothetical protein